jgi:hypothetical protein
MASVRGKTESGDAGRDREDGERPGAMLLRAFSRWLVGWFRIWQGD